MIQPEDIQPGTSYACNFSVQTWIDSAGNPINTENISPGQKVNGTPGIYKGFGVIAVRDTQNKLLKIYDTKLQRYWNVPYDATENIDTVEWRDE
jgi:hypothetical protein